MTPQDRSSPPSRHQPAVPPDAAPAQLAPAEAAAAITRAVRDALDTLPEPHRTVLLLARAGRSYRQIAEQLGVTPLQVRQAAQHGLMALTQVRLAAAPALA